MTMKTRIHKFVVVLAALTMTACTDYPDEWGFYVKDCGCAQELQNVAASGYDVLITQKYYVGGGGSSINNVRMEISKGLSELTTLQTTMRQQGDTLYVTAPAKGLQFDSQYSVTCYVEGQDETIQIGTLLAFSYRKESFKPILGETDFTLVNGTTMQVATAYSTEKYIAPNEVIMSLGQQTQKAKLSNGIATAQFTLSDDFPDCSWVEIIAKNDYGETETGPGLYAFKEQYLPKFSLVAKKYADSRIFIEIENYNNASDLALVPPTFTFQLGNRSIGSLTDATKRIVLDLYSLPIGTYSQFSVYASNIFGTVSRYYNYSVEITACKSYSGDGAVDATTTCIGGVKWNKQWKGTGYHAYGRIDGKGWTSVKASNGWGEELDYPSYTSCYGVLSRDVAAATLGSDYALPYNAQYELLIDGSSRQWCYDGKNYGICFTPTKNGKRFISSTALPCVRNGIFDSFYENSPEMFLPANGYLQDSYSRSSNYHSGIGYYYSYTWKTNTYKQGSYGYYLCSNAKSTSEPYMLIFTNTTCKVEASDIHYRASAYSVKKN